MKGSKKIIERHSLIKRLIHWINVPLLILMIWSGILIYWANDAYITIPNELARTLKINNRLGLGMAWHFFIMWAFFINGTLYCLYLIFTGEWREIIPGIKKGHYKTAQKIAYTGVILMGIGAILSGLAIFKPVTFGLLTKLLGGYQAARLQHFLIMCGFVIFIIIHIIQVLRAGWNNLRAMIAGYEIEK